MAVVASWEADPAILDVAADHLRAGEVVAVPTDTVYGLAAALAAPAAVESLGDLKGRPSGVPIAVLVADRAQADEIGVLGDLGASLADAHWPGALTLVCDARPGVAEVVGATDGSVGIRCPAHDELRALARQVGPLATTSANLHGEATPVEAVDVARAFDAIPLVVDGGPLVGVPSTVVDVRTGRPVILRQGPVALA